MAIDDPEIEQGAETTFIETDPIREAFTHSTDRVHSSF